MSGEDKSQLKPEKRPMMGEDEDHMLKKSLSLNPLERTPDHPPYAEMIHTAIIALNEEGGSTKSDINNFIVANYPDLPFGHNNLFHYHLGKLVGLGEFAVSVKGRYIIPDSKKSYQSGLRNRGLKHRAALGRAARVALALPLPQTKHNYPLPGIPIQEKPKPPLFLGSPPTTGSATGSSRKPKSKDPVPEPSDLLDFDIPKAKGAARRRRPQKKPKPTVQESDDLVAFDMPTGAAATREQPPEPKSMVHEGSDFVGCDKPTSSVRTHGRDPEPKPKVNEEGAEKVPIDAGAPSVVPTVPKFGDHSTTPKPRPKITIKFDGRTLY